jgi:hypothetical protein
MDGLMDKGKEMLGNSGNSAQQNQGATQQQGEDYGDKGARACSALPRVMI